MVIRHLGCSCRFVKLWVGVGQHACLFQPIGFSGISYLFILFTFYLCWPDLINLRLGSLSMSSLLVVGPRIDPPVINTFRWERSNISTVAD